MKNLVCKNKKTCIVLSLALLALCVLSAIGFTAFSKGLAASGDKLSLDKRSLTLEKNESYTLTVRGANGNIEWSSTDTSVISVNNGTIVALKEGGAVVTAKANNGMDRCLVKVTDNGLVLKIDTNVGNENLNILKGDFFDLEYNASYNGKPINAKFSLNIINKQVASVNNGRIKGLTIGSTQLVINATWNGLSAIEVINLGVVNNMIVDFDGGQYLELYNDLRAGATSCVLDCSILEDGVTLNKNQYEVIAADFNNKVINFDIASMTVTGVGKGETVLELTYKSKKTNNIVNASVTVNVDLYTEDKSNTVTLPVAYADDTDYTIDVATVFAGLPQAELDSLSILAVDDVTNSIEIGLHVTDNKIDLSGFIAKGILGDRKWRVQSEKYSYIVKINVKEYNNGKYVVGEYTSTAEQVKDYKLSLSQDSLGYKISVTRISSGELLANGVFEVKDNDRYNGRIKITFAKRFAGDSLHHGVYMNCNPMRLSISLFGKYFDFYRTNEAPYNLMADNYSCADWNVIIALAEDGTCEFDVGNKSNLNRMGTVELTPTALNEGLISLKFKTALLGTNELKGRYAFADNKYSFSITANGKEFIFVQNGVVEQSAKYYDGFNNSFASSGIITKTGASGSWCTFYFYSDGLMYFNTYYGGDFATYGTYELIGSEKSGRIVIDIQVAYCGNKHFEGEYRFDEESERYVFTMYVYGSGFDILNFVQDK